MPGNSAAVCFPPLGFPPSYEGTHLILTQGTVFHFVGKPETPKVPNVFLCETI